MKAEMSLVNFGLALVALTLLFMSLIRFASPVYTPYATHGALPSWMLFVLGVLSLLAATGIACGGLPAVFGGLFVLLISVAHFLRNRGKVRPRPGNDDPNGPSMGSKPVRPTPTLLGRN